MTWASCRIERFSAIRANKVTGKHDAIVCHPSTVDDQAAPARYFSLVTEMTFTTLIPLDASDVERAAMQDDLAAFCSNLKESGKEPTVGVETTSAGDVFIVTVEGEPL